jgi:uncharacterized protein (TIGR02284 family)
MNTRSPVDNQTANGLDHEAVEAKEVLSMAKAIRTHGAIKKVAQLLHDGYEGFAEIGKHLRSPFAKAYFLEESQVRRQFEHNLKAQARISAELGGSNTGALHRAWGDVEAHMGASDHLLLETAATGEDAAVKAYEEALRLADLGDALRLLLEKQQSHILQAKEKLKGFMAAASW